MPVADMDAFSRSYIIISRTIIPLPGFTSSVMVQQIMFGFCPPEHMGIPFVVATLTTVMISHYATRVSVGGFANSFGLVAPSPVL